MPENQDGGYPRLEAWPLNRLKPADYNPRTITAEALGRLTKSMAELGNLQPITVNARSGNVVGGHQRLKCLLALGHKETPVWLVDLEPMKEKAANLALNNLAGTFDETALASVLEELRASDLDLDITGMADAEIDKALGFGEEGTGIAAALSEVFEVTVECADEAQQQEVFEQLTKEGRKCRLHTF